jgi:biotin carboxylase
MPGALHRAGFEVTLLAPPGAFAAHSRHVAQSRLLPENATAQEWLFALIAAIEATAPTILLPGDEMSLRLMQAIVCEPLPGPQPEAIKALSALIVRSLGAPQFYEAAMDKALLQPLMQAAGIRVPDFTVARSPEEAAEAARELGSQVIVKPSNGTGSRDVIDCDTPQAAAEAFLRVLEGARRSPAMGREPSVLVQRRIDGLMVPRTSVAYRGKELAGFARERLQTIAPRRGSTVVRYVHAPELATFSRAAARVLEITGFFAIEYCVQRTTGQAYLIDLSCRMAPSTHTGNLVGVDLCAALAAALRGEEVESLDLPEGSSHMMTLFPQEFWRDPKSVALRQYPSDVPWDDPALWRELLSWRYEARG